MTEPISSKVLRIIDFADPGTRTDLPPELAKELDFARQSFALAATLLAEAYAAIPEVKNGDNVVPHDEAYSNDTSRIIAAVANHCLPKKTP